MLFARQAARARGVCHSTWTPHQGALRSLVLVGLLVILLAVWSPPGARAAAPQVVWQQPLPFLTRGLVVGDGLVHTFSGGDATALDARSGAVAWKYAGRPLSQAARQLGCACQNAAGFAGESLYAVDGGDTVVSLHPSTGAVRWSRVVGQAVAAPPVTAEGLAIVASGDAQGFGVYGLASADGQSRWEVRAPARVLPGLVAADGLIFLPLADGALLALEATTGRQVWAEKVTELGEPLAPQQVGAGLVVLRTQSTAVALDAATGARRWTFPLPEYPSRPLIEGGRVYAAGTGRVAALDAGTGDPLWTRELNAQPASDGATVLGSTLYIPTYRGSLLALDTATGALLWSQSVGNMFAPPTLAGGALYVGTITGELHVLDAATGAARARLAVGGPVLFSPAVGSSLAYVAADAEDGTVLAAVGTD